MSVRQIRFYEMHRLVRQSFRPRDSIVPSSRLFLEGFDFYSIFIGIDVTKQSDYARDRSRMHELQKKKKTTRKAERITSNNGRVS